MRRRSPHSVVAVILLRADLRVLALLAAAGVAVFAAALSLRLGGYVMRRGPLLAVLAIVAVGLSGCGGLSKILQPADPGVPSVLGNLQHCDRTYRGALGAGVTGSFEISCKAQPAGTTPADPPL